MKTAFSLGLFSIALALAACGGEDTGSGGGGGGTTSTPKCGDGKVDEGEECDGDAGVPTCADVDPERETGTPTCDASCKIDASSCTHTPVLTDGTLEVAPECETGKSVWVPTGGKKAVAAAVLTPPSYPFVAKTVRYRITNGIKQVNPSTVFCTSNYAHRLHVYVTDDVSPPAEPANALYIPVDAVSMPGEEPTDITVTLPQELTLEEGQRIVVGVELVSFKESGTAITAVCLLACSQGTSEPESFWSDAVNPPFSWGPVTNVRHLVAVDGTFID